MTRLALALVACLSIAGCAKAPGAVVALSPIVTDAQAFSATHAEAGAKDGHLRLVFAYSRLMKSAESFEEVCVTTRVGGIYSSVWVANDGGLWVKLDHPTATPPSATWLPVGTAIASAQPGDPVKFKLDAGVSLTYSQARPNFPYGETPASLNLDPGKVKPAVEPPELVEAK